MHSSMEMQQVSCPVLPDVLGDGDTAREVVWNTSSIASE